jgi:hypothetical protein
VVYVEMPVLLDDSYPAAFEVLDGMEERQE